MVIVLKRTLMVVVPVLVLGVGILGYFIMDSNRSEPEQNPPEVIVPVVQVMKVSTEYMLRGTQIAMTPLLRTHEGAGITEQIKKNLTPIKARYAEWVNPVTKEVFKHPLYAIPLNKQLADFIKQFDIKEYDDMERISKDEQDKIVKKYWMGLQK